MAVMVDMSLHRAFVRKKHSAYKLLEINLLMPEDTAFISSKSDVHPRRYDRDINPTEKCGQTDGFSALYVYN